MGHDRRFVIGGDSGGLFWGFVPGSMSFKQSSYRSAKYKLPVEPRSNRISMIPLLRPGSIPEMMRPE